MEGGVRERKWGERRRVREVRVREGEVREWSERGRYGNKWSKGEG